MKALVIGGSGFLGGAISEELHAAGWEVVGLQRHPSSDPEALSGDVEQPGLGLDEEQSAALRSGLTHIVSCFGSVDFVSGPRLVALHERGTTHVLEFAQHCPALRRLVHVSSILALGASDEQLDNGMLDVGQRFRSWYEYAKFRAETIVRENADVPVRTVRFGPVLGSRHGRTADASTHVLAVVPTLLRGYPIYLAEAGAFPSYAVDVTAAAGVIKAALLDERTGEVWTFYDPAGPTVAQLLIALCSPWNVMPRIGSGRSLRLLNQALRGRLGVPQALHAYAERWVTFAPDILEELPPDLPTNSNSFMHDTADALKRQLAGAVDA